jgi:hypothetical protein
LPILAQLPHRRKEALRLLLVLLPVLVIVYLLQAGLRP